jgi:hypothetical protein
MPGNPLTDPNWAADAADTVERIVGNVRSRAVTPIVHAARGVVFGLLALFLGLAAVVLVLLIATRGLQALLDLVVSHQRAVYLSYLIIGAVLCTVGLVLMKLRAPKPTQ